METKKKEQNTKAEAETFAATVKGMNRDDQLTPWARTTWLSSTRMAPCRSL